MMQEVQTTQVLNNGTDEGGRENFSSNREGMRTERRALESWARREAVPGGLEGGGGGLP